MVSYPKACRMYLSQAAVEHQYKFIGTILVFVCPYFCYKLAAYVSCYITCAT